MELQGLLRVEQLLAVEKLGSIRVMLEAEAVKEKKDVRQLSEQMYGFVEKNMGNGSTGLAKE